jgi:magnesium chelatase family protein
MIQRYRAKISGPLLDRIDLHIEVPPVATPNLLGAGDGEGSPEVAERVERARHLQLVRLQGRDGLYANGQMGARDVYRFCRADDTSLSLLRPAMARFSLSARSYHWVLKLARTIADLKPSDTRSTTRLPPGWPSCWNWSQSSSSSNRGSVTFSRWPPASRPPPAASSARS